MKILVLATDYPSPDGSVKLQYIHSRNQQYVQQDIDVSVLSFAATADYELDGVNVYTLTSYDKHLKDEPFDLLISHAPNIRHHYWFLKQYGDRYDQFVFFFHGHEVLKMTEVYPRPYDYADETGKWGWLKRWLYDQMKLRIWKKYFKKVAHKSHFVFVSQWMYHMFLTSVGIDQKYVENKTSIIYNGVGSDFETKSYNPRSPKPYDFITIRDNLDGSKYAIDMVVEIARQHPTYQFCVIGQGDFFYYHDRPANLKWVDQVLRHDDMIDWLNQAKCALIPTRLDSQGVMACEIATFGMPIITSNIEVCEEVFTGFPNVGLINNDQQTYQITSLFNQLLQELTYHKNTSYFYRNTIQEEITLFQQLAGEQTTG